MPKYNPSQGINIGGVQGTLRPVLKKKKKRRLNQIDAWAGGKIS